MGATSNCAQHYIAHLSEWLSSVSNAGVNKYNSLGRAINKPDLQLNLTSNMKTHYSLLELLKQKSEYDLCMVQA